MTARMTRAAALAGTTILAGSLALPAFAQDGEAFDLGEVVFDVQGANPFGDEVNPSTLTGMKTATEITEVPQSVKWQPNDYSLITVSAFDVEREDVAQFFVNGGVFDARTLGQLSSTGFEIEADVELAPSLRMRAAYTNLDVTIDTFAADPTIVGKTPQSVVEAFGSVQFAYSPAMISGVELRLGTRYQGASWADNANTLRVGDAWLFDAGATWDFAADWSANLTVTNLADER